MNHVPTKLEKRLRIAGILVVLGLIVEVATIQWSHPTAFLFFLLVGGTLMGLGILFYLYALIAGEPKV